MLSRTIQRISGVRRARTLRRVGLAMALASGSALTLPMLIGSASAATAWAPPASPTTAAPYNECPQVGAENGCGVLIVLNPDGTVTITGSGQGPYDSSDDTLIGVLNNSGVTASSVALTSALDIFGFDGDGVCSSTASGDVGNWATQWLLAGGSITNLCPYVTGATASVGHYEGPGITFSNISADKKSGTVNFTNGLANGGTLFFSLEHPLNQASFSVPTLSSLTTNRSASTVASGTPVTDTATAVGSTGMPPTPAGAISFYVCGPSASSCSSTAQAVGSPVTLTPGATGTATAQSAAFTPTAAGTYCFYAVYNGSNYATAADTGTSANNECFTVTGAAVATAPASSPPPAPIASATVVHTGEPWAGSRPYVVALGAAGLALFGLGMVRRRRFNGAVGR